MKCTHKKLHYCGIQEAPSGDFRLYTCRNITCRTTISEEAVRAGAYKLIGERNLQIKSLQTVADVYRLGCEVEKQKVDILRRKLILEIRRIL